MPLTWEPRSYVKALVDGVPGASYTRFKIYEDAADDYAIAKAGGYVRVVTQATSSISVLFLQPLCSLELVLVDCCIDFKCVCQHCFHFIICEELDRKPALMNVKLSQAHLIARPQVKIYIGHELVHSGNRDTQGLYNRCVSKISCRVTRGNDVYRGNDMYPMCINRPGIKPDANPKSCTSA